MMKMTAENVNKLRKILKRKGALVHSITNPISINQCANAVFAVGARPIMAEHPLEAAEITQKASVLVLNLGNITDVRMRAMKVSGEVAHEKDIPVVLDAVGVACSSFRRRFAEELITEVSPAVIKGNYSEIKALSEPEYSSAGVDSEKIDAEEMCCICEGLAVKYNTVILASGKTDIVTDGNMTVFIENGCSQLAEITGTGCMLGVICGCFVSVGGGMTGAVTACGVMGICGELAETDKGNGSFFVNFLDKLSVLSDEEVERFLKVGVRKNERV